MIEDEPVGRVACFKMSNLPKIVEEKVTGVPIEAVDEDVFSPAFFLQLIKDMHKVSINMYDRCFFMHLI